MPSTPPAGLPPGPADGMPDDLITPKEAAKALRCHLATVYRYIFAGILPAWKRAGHRHLVSRAHVLDLLKPVRARRRVPVARPAQSRQQIASEAWADNVLRGAGLA